MKKWGCILICMALLAGVCGCGKGKSTEAVSGAEQAKDYVYAFTSLEEKTQLEDFAQACFANDILWLTSYRYEEVAGEGVGEDDIYPEEIMEEAAEVETEKVAATTSSVDMSSDFLVDDVYIEDDYYEDYSMNIYFGVSQFDLEGNLLGEFEILLPQDCNITSFCVDKTGTIYTVQNAYGPDPEDPENYLDLYYLVSYSEAGEELFRVQMGENTEEEDWYYVNQIVCTQEGYLVAGSTKGVEVYQTDGTLSKLIESEDSQEGSMYVLRDGRVALLMYGDQDMYMRALDIEKEELSDKITFPFNTYEYSYYTGTSTDLLLSGSGGVYSYNFGDEGLQKIFDFVDSDMICDNLYGLVETGENQLFGCYYDDQLERTRFGLFNKVDPSTIKDKKVLTLACYWLDDDMRRRVVEYNKTNEEYRIHVEDYYRYNTSDDYSIGMTKMNTDIASGNTPDIIALSSDMPVDSYMNKGLFADLLPFLENDPELNKDDYSQNIIELFSRDGKWYQMVPSYYLYTIFGKTSEVGSEPGWTLEDLQALHKEKGTDIPVFAEMTRAGVLNYSLLFCSNQFINWDTGECAFNTQEFMDLLEFVNEFPAEIDYEELFNDPQYWEQQETLYRDGKALLMPYTISSFEDFLYCEQGTFGEEITAIGFPVKEGVGNVIMSNANYAISAKSEYQQEAWDFLRYYLTAEYQDSIEWGWPVLKSSLDKRIKDAQKVPTYIDEFGNEVEYQESYYLNGVEIMLEPLTQADCERVVSYLESAEHVYSYDQAVMDIITEETAAYFDGQKTAKEVSDIIQSRVYIYINESR